MTPEDIDVMARTVWGEARGESFAGKIAVAWVIKNRADKPSWWGSGISGVCKAPYQFSCWLENDPNLGKLMVVGLGDAAFRECLAATAAVLSDITPDTTNGSNHYHTTAISPNWAKGKTPAVIIDHHAFYKL